VTVFTGFLIKLLKVLYCFYLEFLTIEISKLLVRQLPE